MNDSCCVDVDECLDGSRRDGQYRVLIERLLGGSLGEGGAVNKLGGHPGLGGVYIGGEEACRELAADPHAELDFASKPVAECRVSSQAWVDDLDGGQAALFVLAEVDGAKTSGT